MGLEQGDLPLLLSSFESEAVTRLVVFSDF